MLYSADLVSLIRLCIEITFSLGFVQIYCFNVQKKLPFWASCRNITVHSGPGTRGYLDSRAEPFLRYVKKYWFFGEIFTSVQTSSSQQYLRHVGVFLERTKLGQHLSILIWLGYEGVIPQFGQAVGDKTNLDALIKQTHGAREMFFFTNRNSALGWLSQSWLILFCDVPISSFIYQACFHSIRNALSFIHVTPAVPNS